MLKPIKWKSGFTKKWKGRAFVIVCGLVAALMIFFTDDSFMNSGKELTARILSLYEPIKNQYVHDLKSAERVAETERLPQVIG